MKLLIKIERGFFYLLVFFVFLQTRFVWHIFDGVFNEWTSLFIYGTDILIGLILALWAARIFRNESKIKVGRQEMVLAAFLFFVSISILVANNKELGFYHAAKLFEFSLLFLYLKNNFSRLFSVERFWQIFIASALFQSIFAVWQFFRQNSLGLKIFNESPINPQLGGVAKIVVSGVKVLRAYGLMPHPNILAAFLFIAIFGLVYLFIKNYGKLSIAKKIIFGASFCLLALALFLTFSRAVTLIGLAIFVFWLALIFWRQQEYKKPALIVFIFLISYFLFLISFFWPYASSRYEPSAIAGSEAFSLRVFYNRVALDSIEQHPFIGVGAGNFVWTFIKNGNLPEPWMYQPAHNIYLLATSDVGILGLLALLLFIFFIFKDAISVLRQKTFDLKISCFLFLVSCFLLIGLLDHFFWTLQQGQLMLWMMLGILSGLATSPCSSAD